MLACFSQDGITVYHGDWRDVLPMLDVSGVDAVVTDPPYGMNWNTDSTRFTKGTAGARRKWPRVKGDTDAFSPDPWLKFDKCVLWGANHFGQRLPVGTTLVWQKRDADRFGVVLSDAEIIFLLARFILKNFPFCLIWVLAIIKPVV